jgi:hypothetical protein
MDGRPLSAAAFSAKFGSLPSLPAGLPRFWREPVMTQTRHPPANDNLPASSRPAAPPQTRCAVPMRDRRLVDVTIILLIGSILMALVIYFSPKNPYCFGGRNAVERMRVLSECVKGGPLEDRAQRLAQRLPPLVELRARWRGSRSVSPSRHSGGLSLIRQPRRSNCSSV